MNTPTGIASYVIRHARRTDIQQIVSGINAVCAEGGMFYTTCFVPTPQWEAVLYRPETVSNHLLAVAEWDGQIVGVGRLFPGGEFTLLNHVAELGIFVLRPFRHQGIGTKLLLRLMNWATQSGLEKVTLVVFATNQPAIRFFKKHGFIREGCMRRQIKMGGQYIDLIMMGKFLHPA